jgi:hypothetical protein
VQCPRAVWGRGREEAVLRTGAFMGMRHAQQASGTILPADYPSAETVAGQRGLTAEAGGVRGSESTKMVRERGRPAERLPGGRCSWNYPRSGTVEHQLNDYRLYLPVELRRRLGDLSNSLGDLVLLRRLPAGRAQVSVDQLRKGSGWKRNDSGILI